MILITGVAGFIGSHLANRFLEKGIPIIGIDNLNDYYSKQLKIDRLANLKKYSNFFFEEIDLNNKESLRKLFDKFEINDIFHLASQPGVRYSFNDSDSYIKNNIIGFYNLWECIKYENINRFFYASSSSVYGNSDIELNEDLCCNSPINLYAATKKCNEIIAYSYSHLYNIKSIGMRFFTVFGEYGRPDMFPHIAIDSIINGKEIKLYNKGESFREFTSIDNIINGIITLYKSELPKYSLFNIASGYEIKVIDFLELIEVKLKKKANIKFWDGNKFESNKIKSNLSKIKKLGFDPANDLDICLDKTIEWYKKYYSNGDKK